MRLIVIVIALLLGREVVLGQTPTPGNFNDYWATLNEEQRAAIVRGSAREQTYFPDFDYCRYLTELAELTFYFSVASEPFGTGCLNALTALLPSLSTKDGVRAAAMLYRYGHASGRTYLVDAVRQRSDPAAAEILTMNRESDALDDIARAFRIARYKPFELIAAPGAWGAPKAQAALLDGLRANPANDFLMLAAGVARLSDARPLLEAQYEAAGVDDLSKLAAAGALAALAADPSVYRQFLLDQLTVPPSSEPWRIYVVAALGVAGGSQAEAALSAVINQYTDTGAIAGVGSEVAADMSVAAATALGHLNAPNALPVIQALFQKFAGSIRVTDRDRRRGVLGNVLLDLDAATGQQTIRNELGEPWLQRLLTVRGLKRIPRSDVPAKSADVEWNRDGFWLRN